MWISYVVYHIGGFRVFKRGLLGENIRGGMRCTTVKGSVINGPDWMDVASG